MVDLNEAIAAAVQEALHREMVPLLTRLDELTQRIANPCAPRLMTPEEAARSQRVRNGTIYDALQSGELPSIQRPGRGGKLAYLIKPEDAAAWGRTLTRRRQLAEAA